MQKSTSMTDILIKNILLAALSLLPFELQNTTETTMQNIIVVQRGIRSVWRCCNSEHCSFTTRAASCVHPLEIV